MKSGSILMSKKRLMQSMLGCVGKKSMTSGFFFKGVFDLIASAFVQNDRSAD
jgi:hypothetical protein